jgi:hypothetical protein
MADRQALSASWGRGYYGTALEPAAKALPVPRLTSTVHMFLDGNVCAKKTMHFTKRSRSVTEDHASHEKIPLGNIM